MAKDPAGGGVPVQAVGGGSRARIRSADTMELQGGIYTVLAHGDRASPAEIVARYAGTAIGLHAGEIAAGQAAAAPAVARAGRLATLARTGQVLASALVRELAAGDPDLRSGRRVR